LVLTAPVEGAFTVSVAGRPVHRLTMEGLLEPWTRLDGDRVRLLDVDGHGITDCLIVDEPLGDYLSLFERFRELMLRRLGDPPPDPDEVASGASAIGRRRRGIGRGRACAPAAAARGAGRARSEHRRLRARCDEPKGY
jgi:hypothetical protein